MGRKEERAGKRDGKKDERGEKSRDPRGLVLRCIPGTVMTALVIGNPRYSSAAHFIDCRIVAEM